MRTSSAVVAICLVLGSGSAMAQHAQPYAAFDKREVKALSDDKIADLRAGRGMGLALAAELNGYPGPLHVLELADELDLTVEQRQLVEELFDAMKSQAAALGEQVIHLEAELDGQFANQSITLESLRALTSEIGRIQAALRATHLEYHLTTTEVLSAHQVERYAILRGYVTGDTPEHSGHGQHRGH